MIGSPLPKLSIAILLFVAQEQYPAGDHAWLRFKPGTWIKNKVIVKANDSKRETFQKLTFTEKSDKDYSIEEVTTIDGKDQPAAVRKSSPGTIVGKETLTFEGKEYPCSISAATTQNPEGAGEMKFWMPKGNKYPLKVVFTQAGFKGEVTAVAIDEKVKVCGREFVCAKLQGKVKVNDADGTLTVWLSQSIPGAQAKMELKLDTPQGEFTMSVDPVEIHEEK